MRRSGTWADFEYALTYTSVLGQRHHDDTVLLVHLDPAESLRRRGGPGASADRFWPWFDPAFLRAYGEFWHHLDRWVTPGPRWSHHHADDPAVDATLRALLPMPRKRPLLRDSHGREPAMPPRMWLTAIRRDDHWALTRQRQPTSRTTAPPCRQEHATWTGEPS